MERGTKKLRLRRETVRDLTPGTLRQIAGATTVPCDVTTVTTATTATGIVGDTEKFVFDQISLAKSDLLGGCGGVTACICINRSGGICNVTNNCFAN